MGSIDNRQKRGFTLIEVLIASSIAVIILGVVISLYISSQNSFTTGNAFLIIHSDARLALEWMARDIRGAIQLIDSHILGADTYTSATDEIVLEVPSIDAAGDIIDIDNVFDYIVYHLNDSSPKRLERIFDADPTSNRDDGTMIVANNVSSLIFSSGGIELSSIADVTSLTNIAIALTTSRTVVGGRTIQQNLNSQVELRNKE